MSGTVTVIVVQSQMFLASVAVAVVIVSWSPPLSGLWNVDAVTRSIAIHVSSNITIVTAFIAVNTVKGTGEVSCPAGAFAC